MFRKELDKIMESYFLRATTYAVLGLRKSLKHPFLEELF